MPHGPGARPTLLSDDATVQGTAFAGSRRNASSRRSLPRLAPAPLLPGRLARALGELAGLLLRRVGRLREGGWLCRLLLAGPAGGCRLPFCWRSGERL